jgi:hypothetical protein
VKAQNTRIATISNGRGNMVTAAMFALLDRLGATEPARGARPLLDHLDGTRAVLAAWGSPAELCLAGLFHSAYGAEGGAARARDANLEWRGEVRAVIGLAAEELAYLYSALERRHLFGNAVRSGDYAVNDLFAKVEVPVSETTLRSLFELDAANFVEGPLTRFDEFDGEFLARYRSLWEAAQRFVTRQAYAAVIARFDALAEQRRAGKPATA